MKKITNLWYSGVLIMLEKLVHGLLSEFRASLTNPGSLATASFFSYSSSSEISAVVVVYAFQYFGMVQFNFRKLHMVKDMILVRFYPNAKDEEFANQIKESKKAEVVRAEIQLSRRNVELQNIYYSLEKMNSINSYAF